MPCDELPDDLKTLWKEAEMDRSIYSPNQLRAEAEKMQAKRRKDNLILSAVFSSAVASYAFFLFYFHNTLTLVGSGLAVVAFGYLVVDVLVRRARALPDPGETDGLRFYRAELERKRNWHRGIPWRFMMLSLPLILVSLGLGQVFAKISPIIPPLIWGWTLFLLVLLWVLGPAKHRKLARKYQERVDRLDSTAKSDLGTGPTG
jgi:amino acid transporter